MLSLDLYKDCRRTINKDGYVMVYGAQRHPGSNKRGMILEHRLVAAAMLGEVLPSYYSVHHVNGCRHDNRSSNLEIWTTKYHPAGVRLSDVEFISNCSN